MVNPSQSAPDDPVPQRRGALAAWLDARQSQLRYVFTTAEAAEVGLSESALYEALRRQRLAGRVARVGAQRGLWVVVPLEHRATGAPPLEWVLDDLMAALGHPYYLGLRSATAWYGATHYALQVTQVMVRRQLRPLTIGRSRVRFIANAHLADTPTRNVPGQVTQLRVSTPEATAVELLRYVAQSGGISAVVTALSQMQGACDPRLMRFALDQMGDVRAAQRLGYCWERVGARQLAAAVEGWLGRRASRRIALEPSEPGGEVVLPWNVLVSRSPDIDL